MSATSEDLSRYEKTLVERAAAISSVRNDVFTTKWWQLALNLVLGAGALAAMIVTVVCKGTPATVCAILSVVLIIVVIVYNCALRAVTPMSFLQYAYVDGKSGKTYCYQVLSKTRYAFSDGINHIETDRGQAVALAERSYSLYSYDFFARMRVTDYARSDGEKETFSGTVEHKGATVKCKMVFVRGTPYYGSVGGARVKYFDVNNTKDKFVVPAELKRAVKDMGVAFPKVAGLYVRDDIKDPTRQ